MLDPTEISKRLKLFRSIDPKVYDQLVSLLDERLSDITVAVTEAPPDQILVCQGRAQEARKMLQLFKELPKDNLR